MSLETSGLLGQLLGGLQSNQLDIEAGLSPDQSNPLYLVAGSGSIVIQGTSVASSLLYPTDAFVIDHPVYGDIDSPILKIDGDYALRDRLWTHLKMNGNLLDSSVKGNNFTNIGLTFDTGKINNAARWTASTTYARDTINILNQTSFSISLWIKMDTPFPVVGNTLHYLFWVNDDEPALRFSSSGAVLSFLIDGNEGNRKDYSVTPTTFTNWTHLVAVCDYGNELKLYINGILQSGTQTGTVVNNATGSRSIRLGYDGNLQRTMRGFIDDFRIYDKVLSQDQIDYIYNSGTGREDNDYYKTELYNGNF